MGTSRLKKAAWFGVSTLLLLIMVLFADVNRLLEVFRGAKLLYFLPALLFGLSTFLVFALTWHRCFDMVGETRTYLSSLHLYLAGEFLNSVTPIGQLGGEPFMAYIVRDNSDMKYEEALSTVLSGDIINSIPMATFVLAALAYMLTVGSAETVFRRSIAVILLASATGAVLAHTLWFRSEKVEKAVVGFFGWMTSRLGRGGSYLESVEERMAGVRNTLESIGADRRSLVVTVVLAHSYFVFAVISLYFVMASLGAEVGVTSLVFVVAFSGLSNFMPTPGGSGAFEFAMASLLTFFAGIDFAVAAAAAILYRAASYWPIMFIGYLSLVSLEGRD